MLMLPTPEFANSGERVYSAKIVFFGKLANVRGKIRADSAEPARNIEVFHFSNAFVWFSRFANPVEPVLRYKADISISLKYLVKRESFRLSQEPRRKVLK